MASELRLKAEHDHSNHMLIWGRAIILQQTGTAYYNINRAYTKNLDEQWLNWGLRSDYLIRKSTHPKV